MATRTQKCFGHGVIEMKIEMSDLDDVIDEMLMEKAHDALDRGGKNVRMKETDANALGSAIRKLINDAMKEDTYQIDEEQFKKAQEIFTILGDDKKEAVDHMFTLSKAHFITYVFTDALTRHVLCATNDQAHKTVIAWMHGAYINGLGRAIKSYEAIKEKHKQELKKAKADETNNDPMAEEAAARAMNEGKSYDEALDSMRPQPTDE